MIDFLTRSRVSTRITDFLKTAKEFVARMIGAGDKGALALKLFMAFLVLGLSMVFYGTLVDYRNAAAALTAEGSTEVLQELPSVFPVIWQGIGVFFALVAFLVSLFVRGEVSNRANLIVISLWIAAVAGLIAWLPADVIQTQRAVTGKALAGETASVPAYLGQLFLVIIVILSIPLASMFYFRLSLMDRYVVHSFLSPFFFCLFSFIAIWVIADFTDNGSNFSGLPFSLVVTFYRVQVPSVILFVMPIVVLLAGLFALSKMSRSNELISMIGAGRSVLRILLPLLVVGAYSSLICLAFKYEWAPASVGYKEAIMDTAKKESWARKHGKENKRDIWAKHGWLHVNEVDRRTWFVGHVPLKLSDEMADVIVVQLNPNNQPRRIWKAKRAKWVWNSKPPKWVLSGVQMYRYDDQHIPRIRTEDEVVIDDWSETPWKVLSSSQNPEYLGIPGLTMYLNANEDLDERQLAPFRTNWWYVFAEPLSCFVMLLVAAPLGIVYSRRGVMGGVTAAIVIFALMYVMRGTLLAMGHGDRIPPFLAAWLTNLTVGAIGCWLLWFRAQNREIPKLKSLFTSLFRGGKSKRATA